MRAFHVRWLSVFSLLFLALPASAQRRGAPSGVRVTPYVGLLAFGHIAEGPLGTSLSNESAPVVGVQLGVNLTPQVAVVGDVGYSDSNLQVGVPVIGGWNVADSRILLYDVALQLRAPVLTKWGSGFVPYVEGGVGAMRTEVSAGSFVIRSTSPSTIVGGGVDFQVNNALGFRLMARDHIGAFDFQEALGFGLSGRKTHNWVLGAGVNFGL